MLIEIPVLIAFDSIDERSHSFHRHKRVFTLRYDTDNSVNTPAQYCREHPPRASSAWTEDKTGIFFDLFTRETDRWITERADADPEGYAVAVS